MYGMTISMTLVDLVYVYVEHGKIHTCDLAVGLLDSGIAASDRSSSLEDSYQ